MRLPGQPVVAISRICAPATSLDVYVSVSYTAGMSQSPSHAEIDTPDLKNRESYTISDLSEEFGGPQGSVPDLYQARPRATGLDHASEKCRIQPG